MSAPPHVRTTVELYVRLRLALATLARQIEIVDYVDPALAAPLKESMQGIEALLEHLGTALAHDARRQPSEDGVQDDAPAPIPRSLEEWRARDRRGVD